MTDNEVKTTATSLTKEDIQDIVRLTVKNTLIQIGVDNENPLEMQKDHIYLREVRQASEMFKQKTKLSLIGVFIASLFTVLVMGLKDFFSN